MIAYHIRIVSTDGERVEHAVEKDGYSAEWWANEVSRQVISRGSVLAVYATECKCPQVRSICETV
jgi:hypothetical protein